MAMLDSGWFWLILAILWILAILSLIKESRNKDKWDYFR